MFAVFWDSQGVLLAHFQKCSENVNSALNYEVLLNLWDVVRRKLLGQLARGFAAQATEERIQELQWELLEHLACSLDLGPSDFQLFGLLKNYLGGKHFADDKKVETEKWKWLRQQSNDLYAVGFDTLVKRWDKCYQCW
jgi:hypothetical protein